MNNKLSIVLLIGILSLISCKQKKENDIPKGAFSIIYAGHLYINGEIDSIKGNFVFDTGAFNLYFDSTFYANNGFDYAKTSIACVPGAGIRTQKVISIEDTVEFYFNKFHYKTTIVPILQLKPILGDFIDGILGMDYFNNRILEINYEKEYMKIFSNIDSVNLQGWSKIKLTKRDNKFYLPLEVVINDTISISGEYLLDFGSGGTISLTSKIAKKYTLKDIIQNKVEYLQSMVALVVNLPAMIFLQAN